MLTTKVLVCDTIQPDGIAMLKEARFEVHENPTITSAELEKQIAGYDAVIVRGRTRITAPIMQAGTRLRAVARSGVGLDNIELEFARQKKIKVISTPAAPTRSVAELTISLMLGLLRRIPYADRTIKEDKWVKAELMGTELNSKTIGVVGSAGRIGLEVSRIAVLGFGSTVIGYDVIDFSQKAKEIGITPISQLNQLLSRADIISIHVPYLPSTHHLINKETIMQMKQGAMLVNASRGDIVDGQALLDALKSGRIGGAAFDVFHHEPPSDEWERELVQLDNVICTPHIGAQTIETQRLESTQLAEQLIEVFKT